MILFAAIAKDTRKCTRFYALRPSLLSTSGYRLARRYAPPIPARIECRAGKINLNLRLFGSGGRAFTRESLLACSPLLRVCASARKDELALSTHSRHTSLGMTNVRNQRRYRHSETEDVRQGLGRCGQLGILKAGVGQRLVPSDRIGVTSSKADVPSCTQRT